MKLQVWHIPQVPMKPFTVDVDTVAEGVKLMRVLADYDAYQYEHLVKGDYSNVNGLRMWVDDNGDGAPGWTDWYDDDTGHDDPEQWLEEQAVQ